ncbi:MAG TPA: winged helix-turn-helix domain-containing protein [Vicinamibacterales bacterium]|nr:winged helix-turn-helix domain-containing protein [Vicinamibacterales bacterium]
MFQFGDVCVDLRRLVVTRGGAQVELEPKAFDVLRYLLENADRLVTKDELMETVWRDTFVTPNVLTRAIAQLRRALGDDAREARYIETVARRGYRFIAHTVSDAPVSAAPRPITSLPAAPVPVTVRIENDPPATVAPPSAWGMGARLAATVLIAAATGGVVLLARLPARHAPAALNAVPTRVTIGSGNNTSPAISPDGRAVAFSSDRTGSLEIYVVGLAPGSEEVALTHDGGQNMQPDWSPDGRWIAFHSRRRGGVWIVPSTGGTPQQVIDRGSSPAWSPDSDRLVYTPDEGGLAGQQVLWTVKRDGSDRRQLTHLGQPAGGHNHPAWSHSGRFIAFAVSYGVQNDAIWIVDAAGGVPRLLTPGHSASHPRFTPADDAIVWTGNAAAFNGRIFRIGFDAVAGTAIGEAAIVTPFENGSLQGLSIADTGAAVFGVGATDTNLWTIDLDRDGSASTPARLTSDVVRNGQPDYSRDGRIAFSQLGTGLPMTVWAIDPDGSHRVRLAPDGPAGDPSWSGDGTRVLVKRWDAPRSAGLVWIDAASRRATPTGVNDPGVRSPRPSPDSRSIAFHLIESDGSMNVWTQSLDGGPRRRVTHDPEAASFPVWSPDGKWLAVEVKRGERTQIGVVDKDGGPIELLTNDPGQNWPHAWSPDGERIAYAAERGAVWNIWEVARRTHATRQLTDFTSSSGYVRYPSWSPDGRRIVFERETQTATIWTIQLETPRSVTNN